MEIFNCTFEVNVNGNLRTMAIQAPRMIIEQEFLKLMQQAYHLPEPISVKLLRMVPVYSEIDKCWKNIENSITYENPAYLKTNHSM